MELFYRRYLCFFSFLFLFASFVGTLLGDSGHVAIIAIALALLSVAFVLLCINKRKRFEFAVIFTAVLFVTIALVNSFFFVRLPLNDVEKYVGKTHPAEMKIISCQHSSEDSSEYLVRVEQIGDETLDVKAYVYCDFPSELSFGNKMLAVVTVCGEGVGSSGQSSDTLLSLTVDSSQLIMYSEGESGKYFSIDGIVAFSHSVRKAFGEHVDKLFGKEISALVKGFLINDKSDIPQTVKSDFKRSGTLHLLAVSGLHVALLMGSLELLMKKVFIPKTARCILMSFISVFFLALTGFSGSAVRSVIMLLAVYLSYLLWEDGDAVTVLFVSIFLIILVSPFSVYDLGMWMSFFATLGLLTVYPFLESLLPKRKKRKDIKTRLVRLGINTVKAVLLTLVANFFLLPIMWYFFGEISLSAIPANLVLSPLSTLFLPLCAIAVLIGWIPGINTLFTWALGGIEYVIIIVADFFADIRGGILSLRYPFVPVLTVAFALVFSVLLVINLKNKLWICAPPIAFAAVFAVCLTVYNLSAQPQIKYLSDSGNDLLIVEQAGRTVICEGSYGGYLPAAMLADGMDPCATEIERYVVTHCHKGHTNHMKRLLSAYYVRELYLPLSNDKAELEILSELYEIALAYDTRVVFYKPESIVPVYGDISMTSYVNRNGDREPSITVEVSVDGSREFIYSDSSASDVALNLAAESRYFLIGVHGDNEKRSSSGIDANADVKVIFATRERALAGDVCLGGSEVYVISEDKKNIKMILPLS